MRQMRQISTRLVVISLVCKYYIISNVYYTIYINCSSFNCNNNNINTSAAYLFRLTQPMLDRIQESIHTNSTVTMERLITVIHDEFQVKVWRTTGYTSCTPCSSLPFLVLEFMRVSIIVHLILYISILSISYTVVNYINLPCSSTLVHCTFKSTDRQTGLEKKNRCMPYHTPFIT